MIVLGFDTATPATAIGLRLADGRTLQARDDPGPGERPGHATRLLPLAAALLDEAELSFGDLERIAVGVGPGTFTGLRIGVASARGLAQSLDAELVGVSSLQALAAGVSSAGSRQGEEATNVLAMIDARRGEVFAAAYDRVSELLGPRVVAPWQLVGVVGEAGEGCLAIGDGAVRYRELLEAQGARVPDDGSPEHQIGGAAVCEIAASLPAAGDVREVLPAYLRRPDAEIALERARRSAERV